MQPVLTKVQLDRVLCSSTHLLTWIKAFQQAQEGSASVGWVSESYRVDKLDLELQIWTQILELLLHIFEVKFYGALWHSCICYTQL